MKVESLFIVCNKYDIEPFYYNYHNVIYDGIYALLIYIYLSGVIDNLDINELT